VNSLNAMVLLKGPGTLISRPGGDTWINPTGTEALAQGGTGDVLTGLTAALVAQRPGDEMVIPLAAWIHGRAGELVASRVRPHPATASLLVEALLEVIHSLV
jgi:NAD(P)H-hydrate epimerase